MSETMLDLVVERRAKAEEWVRYAFADDIITAGQSEIGDDAILLLPAVEAGSWVLIYEYYTGVKHINTSEKGTGNRLMVGITRFLDMFSQVIQPEKLTEDILTDLIAYSKEKKMGYEWYFRLCMDRITHENFVDIRMIFSDLYMRYSATNSDPKHAGKEERLKENLEAQAKFMEFMRKENARMILEGEGYKKEFFSL